MLLSTPCLWLCDPPWPASLSSLQPSLFDFLQLVLEGPLGPVLGPRRGGLAGQGDPSGHCRHVFWKIQFSSKNTVVATNRGNIFIGFCLVTLEIYRVFIRIVGDWFVSWLVGWFLGKLALHRSQDISGRKPYLLIGYVHQDSWITQGHI